MSVKTFCSHKHLDALHILPLVHFQSSCQAVTFPSTHHSQPFLCIWQTNKIRKLQRPNTQPTELFCFGNNIQQKLLGCCLKVSDVIQAHYCCWPITVVACSHQQWCMSRDQGMTPKVQISLQIQQSHDRVYASSSESACPRGSRQTQASISPIFNYGNERRFSSARILPLSMPLIANFLSPALHLTQTFALFIDVGFFLRFGSWKKNTSLSKCT